MKISMSVEIDPHFSLTVLLSLAIALAVSSTSTLAGSRPALSGLILALCAAVAVAQTTGRPRS